MAETNGRRHTGEMFKSNSDDDTFGIKDLLLANTTEDIQKNRHRKDPFGERYIQLLRRPLEEV